MVANGSADHAAGDWKRDLMSGGRSGSVSRCNIAKNEVASLASGLAFPYGLAMDDRARLLVSESWLHRIVALDPRGSTGPSVVLGDLPAYPARLSRSSGGGFWLALFAPRNQLVEFILQEEDYRRAMNGGRRARRLGRADPPQRQGHRLPATGRCRAADGDPQALGAVPVMRARPVL